jgi:hypothetical protein
MDTTPNAEPPVPEDTPLENVTPPPPQCSFCTLYNTQVQWLIAGPNGVFICDQCVDICTDIIKEYRGKAAQESAKPGIAGAFIKKFFKGKG